MDGKTLFAGFTGTHRAMNPAMGMFAFFIDGAKPKRCIEGIGKDDARSLDHTTLEAAHIRS